MNRDSILGGLKALGSGLLQGIIVVLLIVVCLVLVAQLATADEPDHIHTDAQVETLITAVDNLMMVVEVEFIDPDPPDCERSNKYTQYMLDRIAEEVERHPELLYIYQPTIDLLNESWCTK